MRIAAISDIHGNKDALAAVLKDIDRHQVDIVVNLGDILSGPLWPRETADLLIKCKFPTIRGNHERVLITENIVKMRPSDAFAASVINEEHLNWMRLMPENMWLTDEVFLCHGTPQSDIEYFVEELRDGLCLPASIELVKQRARDYPAKVILCGHTHRPQIVDLGDGRLVVNPGSVGLQAITMDQPYRHVIGSKTPHAHYAIIEKEFDKFAANVIAVPYDWEAAANLALVRNRKTWAEAIQTGWVSSYD